MGGETMKRAVALTPCRLKGYELWLEGKTLVASELKAQLHSILNVDIPHSTIQGWLGKWRAGRVSSERIPRKYPILNSDGGYQCDKCGKTFKTGHAYGGHTTHCLKMVPRVVPQPALDVKQLSASADGDGDIVDAFVAKMTKLREDKRILKEQVITLQTENACLRARCDLAEAKAKDDWRARLQSALANSGD